MSERKTAEIKFRIEPSVKARWQAAASEETDGNLSELITSRMNVPTITKTRDWQQLDDHEWVVDMSEVKLERTEPLAVIKNVTDASPQDDMKDDWRSEWSGGEPKSWMFEGRNG